MCVHASTCSQERLSNDMVMRYVSTLDRLMVLVCDFLCWYVLCIHLLRLRTKSCLYHCNGLLTAVSLQAVFLFSINKFV